MHQISTLACALILWLTPVMLRADLPEVRVGVLQFGTVNWELDVIRHHGLDRKHGFKLVVTGFGGKNATHVALQGGSVDVIVSDWIWVNRQRGMGRDYSFAPYSNATGSLMLAPSSGIKRLSDLQGRKIGIAGGPLDKSWLLFRAYSQQRIGRDLKDVVVPSFGAPPLLNKLAERGELDGVINFWHYAARLEAGGFTPLLKLDDVLRALGITRTVPLIGWVFSEGWASGNASAIDGLLKASREAKALLDDSSSTEWARVRPMMKAESDAIFAALVDGFRSGMPDCFGETEIDSAGRTFAILAQMGGESLTGTNPGFDRGTFWPGHPWGACRE